MTPTTTKGESHLQHWLLWLHNAASILLGDREAASRCRTNSEILASLDSAVASLHNGGMIDRAIEERDPDPAGFSAVDLVAGGCPVVLRGYAADWPVVTADDPLTYLKTLDSGAPIALVEGAPDTGGRLFYSDDRSALNFTKRPAKLDDLIDRLRAASGDSDAPVIAAQATDVRKTLPGFVEAHPMPLLAREVPPRIWIGNRVVVAPHHDMASNIAVVVAGRRRFTLIPPDQTRNLYIGPFEFTPAGTPVSMVDPEAPDFDRYPRARDALEQARFAELAPGDALYIPHMWWHHVRSLDDVSILVNYWWNEADAPQPGLAPIDAMVHAILALGDLPAEQRAAWQAMFDQFVFADDREGLTGFAADRQGLRGNLNDEVRTRLRRQLGAIMAR